MYLLLLRRPRPTQGCTADNDGDDDDDDDNDDDDLLFLSGFNKLEFSRPI
jgi:hypothetical protein